MVSITSDSWFVLRVWKSIIVKFIPIFQKGVYILLGYAYIGVSQE